MTMKTTLRPMATAAAAGLLALAACSDGANDNGQGDSGSPSGETLAQTISKADGLSTVTKAVGDSGLSQIFDGAGSYTIFAPSDQAFADLGEAGAGLGDPEQRAVMVAILRDHIVPGYLTPTDIESAIDSQGGSVKVETMGDHTLRFTRDDGGVRVTNEDGSSAMLSGGALKASNGVAIPLDGVLKKLDAASG